MKIELFTVPETYILALVGVFILIAMLLCLGKCFQKLLEKRKRMKKALQYNPGEDLSRVSPGQGDNIDIMVTPVEDVQIWYQGQTDN